MPVISVLMPVYNAERYVAAAVASVLTQTLAELELIAVDDGSTDGSLGILRHCASRDSRIRVLSRENTGIAGAMNDALEAAGGKFITRLDADDWYPRDRLEWQYDWLLTHPEYEAVTGSFAATDATGTIVAPLSCGLKAVDITSELRSGVTRTHLCAAMLRATVARRLEGFRRDLVTSEDVEFQLRLGRFGPVWYEPRLSYYYRLHDESIIHTQDPSARGCMSGGREGRRLREVMATR
jgi:glycosyltransferase involved in cell wall biosynthesis